MDARGADSGMDAALLKSRFHHALCLAKHHAAAWRHLYATWDEQIVLAHFAAERADGALPTTLIAFEDDDRLLGSISLVWNDLPGREDLNPWVASLFVLPVYRARGVGSFLLRQAERLLRLNGEHEAYVFTEGAQGFFERHGWSRIEEDAAQGHPVSILKKTGFR